jgi:hypothetical protein
MQKGIWMNNNGGKEKKRKNMTITIKQKKRVMGKKKNMEKRKKTKKTKTIQKQNPLDLGFEVMATFKTVSTFFFLKLKT